MSYTVASTCDYPKTISTAHPIMKNTCAIFGIVALMTGNAVFAEPVRSLKVESCECVSTSFEAESLYNRGISLSWDGISVMKNRLEQSLAQIAEIEELENNWNGNGASAFTSTIIQKVRELVIGLVVQPTILPTGRASIQLEYENEDGDYLEFEIFENGRLKMFSYKKDGCSETKDILSTSVNEVVYKFYGHVI